MKPRLLLSAALLLASCVRDPQAIGALTTGASGGGSGGSGDAADTAGTTAPLGPVVSIHIAATAARFEHTDAWSGQTPREYFIGVRSLTLLDEEAGAPDLLVFDLGTQFEEARLGDGDDTMVARVAASTLARGTFTRARVEISHIRFQADAVGHAMTLDVPGQLEVLQVLSDGTELRGMVLDQGFWEYVFSVGGTRFTLGGPTGAPSPLPRPGGDIQYAIEGGEAAIYFPVRIPVDPDVPDDVRVTMQFNVFEAFRWEDEARMGYVDGSFDVAQTAFEPIRQMGANEFVVLIE